MGWNTQKPFKLDMRKETVDIIGDLIQDWKIPFKINKVTDNLNGTYTLETCNTYYLQAHGKYNFLTLAGTKYQVTGVQNNTTVIIKGTIAPIVGSYKLDNPFYFNGTILQTNVELKDESDTSKKTPMIYLKRPFEDRFYKDDSALDREANITLFFLTYANFEAWRTADHDRHAIKPMRNLMYAFIEMLKRNSNIGIIQDYVAIDRIKFGVTISNGVTKSYWDDKLSGVELSLTLPIKQGKICSC